MLRTLTDITLACTLCSTLPYRTFTFTSNRYGTLKIRLSSSEYPCLHTKIIIFGQFVPDIWPRASLAAAILKKAQKGVLWGPKNLDPKISCYCCLSRFQICKKVNFSTKILRDTVFVHIILHYLRAARPAPRSLPNICLLK